MNDDHIHDQIEAARAGSREALEAIVLAIQDDIYGLAMRMLWHPQDAQDATQEILVRVITHLGGFRGDASFRTWVYRIATNSLLTTRKRRAERQAIDFDTFADDLATGLGEHDSWSDSSAGERRLIEEVKIGCSQAMLQCLDREHRLAYVLGEILELSSHEGAEILEISRAAFRKRLSRARQRLHGFMREHCGLVSEQAACRCHRRLESAVRRRRVDPDALLFAAHATRPGSAAHAGMAAVETLQEAAAVQRSNPDYAAPERLVTEVRRLLASEPLRVLSEDAP